MEEWVIKKFFRKLPTGLALVHKYTIYISSAKPIPPAPIHFSLLPITSPKSTLFLVKSESVISKNPERCRIRDSGTSVHNEYLAGIDEEAQMMFNSLVIGIAEREDVTEQLKAENQIEWVQRMNSIRY